MRVRSFLGVVGALLSELRVSFAMGELLCVAGLVAISLPLCWVVDKMDGGHDAVRRDEYVRGDGLIEMPERVSVAMTEAPE
jgi:hypothetical protein